MQLRSRLQNGHSETYANGHSPVQNGGPKRNTGSLNWGRAWTVDLTSHLGCLFLLFVCPLMPLFFYVSCTHHQCSLLQTMMITIEKPQSILQNYLPSVTLHAAALYFVWILLQVALALLPDVLHRVVPVYTGGLREGAVTPAGNVNLYRINGLQAWIITHLLWFANAFYFRIFEPSIIFRNWGSLLVVINVIAYVLCVFVYVKGLYFPTHVEDCKRSGNFLYDFCMGVEFNPRIGSLFDFKLFFNGRPGIVAWTLINLSFAWHQYEQRGYVCDSMILVNILQALYVIDFFWNEAWYLKTIDICHEHFGWMLAWGDLVWLPYMYTLQGFYLAHHPIDLGPAKSVGILLVGFAGYSLFRSCNAQKDSFRALKDKCFIWGKKPEYIECTYTSADGNNHRSTLLCSGWWGLARHMNYTGDLIGALTYSLSCGSDHLLPYFYVIFLFTLLVHRIYRDEHRCEAKYGDYWRQYTKRVPYRLLPGLY